SAAPSPSPHPSPTTGPPRNPYPTRTFASAPPRVERYHLIIRPTTRRQPTTGRGGITSPSPFAATPYRPAAGLQSSSGLITAPHAEPGTTRPFRVVSLPPQRSTIPPARAPPGRAPPSPVAHPRPPGQRVHRPDSGRRPPAHRNPVACLPATPHRCGRLAEPPRLPGPGTGAARTTSLPVRRGRRARKDSGPRCRPPSPPATPREQTPSEPRAGCRPWHA